MNNNKGNNNNKNKIKLISWISSVDETQPSWNEKKNTIQNK